MSLFKDRNIDNLISVEQLYKTNEHTSKQLKVHWWNTTFFSIIYKEKYMFWIKNRENSDVVGDIFLTRSDSMKLLNMFHLILIFECMCKTNRYRLPLLEIVGVKSSELAFLLGLFTWNMKGVKFYMGIEEPEQLMLTKFHVNTSLRQHMGYLVHVNYQIYKYKVILFHWNSFLFFLRKLYIEEYVVIEKGSWTQLNLNDELKSLRNISAP